MQSTSGTAFALNAAPSGNSVGSSMTRATNRRIKAPSVALARPIDIPAPRNRQVERPPLPLDSLRKLDRHAWDSYRDILARWADGSGIGPHLDIVPGSPPRRKHFF